MTELPKLVNMVLDRQHSKGRHRSIGSALAEEIKDGGFDVSRENTERFCQEQECSIGVYYYVRKLLLETGLIKKEKNKLVIDLELTAEFTRQWNSFMYNKL